MVDTAIDNEPRDLVSIARTASLYDWLVGLTRHAPRPPELPARLQSDVGMPTYCGTASRFDTARDR